MGWLRSLVPTIAAASIFLAGGTAAQATTYILDVQARVAQVGYSSMGSPTIDYTGPSQFHVGDMLHLTATFDTDDATPQGGPPADQRSYAIPGSAAMTAGTYSTAFSSLSLLLWNDRISSGLPPRDRQSFTFVNDPVPGAPPFGAADGIRKTETLTFIAYDDSATALAGVSLADLVSGGFNTLLLNYNLAIYSGVDGSYAEQVFAATDRVSFTLTAVPEPAGWAMMVAGFGLIGAGLRRQPRLSSTLLPVMAG
ncbi:PEPxxWA-CTERM sorting domain-containing protein [Sphingomonas sp.]|uniref:PEPxxWA-CTERM sorting domain-containing protein n=1 Tax=Sphingomonas sp. TaxID=28214 RepID=UPI0025FF6B3B|nr:PEPxxWA-CTERM sorting domain-containing protein [Sphingomonas sp.]